LFEQIHCVDKLKKEVGVLRKIDSMSYLKLIQEPIAVDPKDQLGFYLIVGRRNYIVREDWELARRVGMFAIFGSAHK